MDELLPDRLKELWGRVERKQLTVLLWMFALLVGVKALQGILNYQESLDLSYALEAVTGHEDVVFFDLAIVLSLVMTFLASLLAGIFPAGLASRINLAAAMPGE